MLTGGAPRTGRRAAALPPEERRRLIVAATLPLILEHGEMLTTREIADAAGIAEGTIFRAFPDKDALIAAVVEAAVDPAPFDEAVRAIDADLALEAAVEAAVKLIQKRVVDMWRITSSVGPRFAEAARRSLTVNKPLADLFTGHKASVRVSPAEAASMLVCITLAVTHPNLVAEPMAPAKVVQLFLHGVGTDASAEKAASADKANGRSNDKGKKC
jgi:AcrR family transcriptional regulator